MSFASTHYISPTPVSSPQHIIWHPQSPSTIKSLRKNKQVICKYCLPRIGKKKAIGHSVTNVDGVITCPLLRSVTCKCVIHPENHNIPVGLPDKICDNCNESNEYFEYCEERDRLWKNLEHEYIDFVSMLEEVASES